MSYAAYKALFDEREKLKERVKEMNLALCAAYIRLPLRQYNVSFVIRSTGTADDVSESRISDPLSAVVYARQPNMARAYTFMGEDVLLAADAPTMEAVSEAEAEIEDLLEDGPIVSAISFDHEIEIKSVVDDGLVDETKHSDSEIEYTELITT